MNIARDTIVTLDYTVTDPHGHVLGSSLDGGPLVYVHGGDSPVPGMDDALEGRSPGEQTTLTIPPDHAYGRRDPSLVRPVPRWTFAGVTHLTPGMQFQAPQTDGWGIVTVVDVQGDTVTLDANHPLAGLPLNFSMIIRDVREATPTAPATPPYTNAGRIDAPQPGQARTEDALAAPERPASSPRGLRGIATIRRSPRIAHRKQESQ